MILLNHLVVQNSPSRETISAGLGPVEPYGLVILALIIIGITIYFKNRKN